MFWSTAHLLVVVMLFTSGRLLACGLECLDESAVSAEASCHQDSAPDAALNGDGVQACLLETPALDVTGAKPGAAHALVIPPPATVLTTTVRPSEPADARRSFQLRFESPHSPAPSVLRL